MSTLIETAPVIEAPAAAEAPTPKKHRVLRLVISLVVFGVALLALWPAQYGGFTGLTIVNGHSMEPTYHTGDLVLSLREPAYQPGEVVSYLIPKGQPGAGGRVIHRVLSVSTTTGTAVYTTQGDNNTSTDPWHFGSSDVLGKAVFSVPSIGTLLGKLANPLILGLAAAAAVFGIVWRFGRDPKKKNSSQRRHRTTRH
ncbi:MAG: signal peptidase [Microbacteriaceae bacterium]|jgi:signal peptidase|nr:signal peptidase [Microbacteriaceae bacterium]